MFFLLTLKETSTNKHFTVLGRKAAHVSRGVKPSQIRWG